jgi:asparagine synthase (glutamine-hydrolysing)
MAFSYGAFFPNRMLGGSVEHDISVISPRTIKAPDILSLVSAVDAVTYLPTDILTKVDRAAMAVGLETRVPLLDHRIVEFAFSIPSSYKVRDGQTKWPLKQILKSYVPDSIFNRPKMGFGVPIREWLKGPLRSWAADLLLIGSSQDDLLNREMIEKMWCDHQSGAWDYSDHLWRVLMFRAWQMHHG